jgi:DNA-binding transcriptional regulator YiaG
MTAEGVRQARARLGLAQRELAGALGVHITAVQRWEGGERGVPAPVARLLLAVERDPPLLAVLRALG